MIVRGVKDELRERLLANNGSHNKDEVSYGGEKVTAIKRRRKLFGAQKVALLRLEVCDDD